MVDRVMRRPTYAIDKENNRGKPEEAIHRQMVHEHVINDRKWSDYQKIIKAKKDAHKKQNQEVVIPAPKPKIEPKASS